MRTRFRRLRAATVLGLLAPALFMAGSVALPGVAEARCVGSTSVTSTLNVFGSTYVSETPVAGTCNGNNLYQGTFYSHYQGWRATVWIQNGGLWKPYYGGYNNTTVYSYSFTDDNSHSLMSLCLDNRTVSWCGWGNYSVYNPNGTHDPYFTYSGVDYGF
jgi:hypothetical protein